MTDAAPGTEPDADRLAGLESYVVAEGDGCRLHLLAEGVHCGGCVRKIESALEREPGVTEARVNLTSRRLTLAWQGDPAAALPLVGKVEALGYRLVPFDASQAENQDGAEQKALLRAMGVAGFAAANVMLLSVAVWAGHAQGMTETTRTLLHWFSALVALPAIAIAGQPFFRSALAALRHGHTNMDVPISLAVILAPAVSLFETIRHGPHAYFDSAVMLLFFLLVGRYLDRQARGRARQAATRLLALGARAVTVIGRDGRHRALAPRLVEPGMTVLVTAGERVGVDGRVRDGSSEVDTSLITGESVPQAVAAGDMVFAGTLNMSAPLTVTVARAADDTLLAEVVRLMEVAEKQKGRFVTLADRLASWYAPVVHGLALAAFLGWWLGAGLAWTEALLIACAVLIITCPCALGLAVPAVQVVASERLLRRGVLLKAATALERFAQVRHVVFDKTGTLTRGHPELVDRGGITEAALRRAAGMAAQSRHPLARALRRAVPDAESLAGVTEHPGLGLEVAGPGLRPRLGRRAWAAPDAPETAATDLELWFADGTGSAWRLVFADRLRPDAAAVVADLGRAGYSVELLSGDRAPAVAAVAGELGIGELRAEAKPADKVARLDELARAGTAVLMVGDGLNDAPALAGAHASLSPASAIDISQTTADAVFQGDRLGAVVETLAVARAAGRLVRQNLALAFAYNVVTVPIALAGLVTPLIAAIAMSASSILVVSNALRLGGRRLRLER